MLFLIGDMRFRAPKAWLSLGMLTPVALATFLSAMFEISAGDMLRITGVVACAGVAAGIYVAYRAKFDAQFGLCFLFYAVIVLEGLLAGGLVAYAPIILGRPDLRWPAFYSSTLFILSALFFGSYLEAKAQGWRWSHMPQAMPGKWEEYIDYARRQVSPLLTARNGQPPREYKSAFLLMGAGVGIVPLLFEYFGGARKNEICLVAGMPVVLAYLNITTFGPAFFRLLFVRRLEKSLGYRFQNSDYEKFQELRRGFFLARWLMKDYRPPMPRGDAETSTAPSRQDIKKRKRRR